MKTKEKNLRASLSRKTGEANLREITRVMPRGITHKQAV